MCPDIAACSRLRMPVLFEKIDELSAIDETLIGSARSDRAGATVLT